MKWILVGLGNIGSEYDGTRHNVGRDVIDALAKKFPQNLKAAEINVYMNNSGGPIKKLVPSKKAAERLVVVHDDLDLGLGKVKISFGSGSGGHRGVESVIKALKTRDFVRVRVGISPTTPSGKVKKPDSKKVVDFVLGKFRASELEKLKKVKKVVFDGLSLLASDGLGKAMTEVNSR